ncbi:MAG: type II secretion system minor pseudopilin GspK [Gammaproteobacteria bacterium]|nr:type II secretion system minor pseudopilin GspK [Gammaproteobacteria bacterium]MDH3450296.1 type II secretion system minor pseudopilin GspK [Gammaproteobacteria bacterium]
MALSSIRGQRGLALLMAMLIVTIATTIAVSIIYEEKFTIRKTGHIQAMDRAGLYAVGLEDWARIYLREDREESDVDSLDEYWASGIPGLPIEGGYLTGYLQDEQGKFNLNQLPLSELEVTRFRRLCDNLGVDDRFIPALMDWIDEDFDIRYPDGMEENYESYRVANREMVDISELRLVHNVTPEIYEKLEPHITALPTPTTLNVNTMSETIFQSLGEEGDVKRFLEERENDPFASIEEFIERLQLPYEVDGLSVDTRFFRAYGQVVQGEQVFNLTSLVYRDDGGKTLVLNRTLGQY